MSDEAAKAHEHRTSEHHSDRSPHDEKPCPGGILADEHLPSSPGNLLADPRLENRGNAPVRAALMRQMQQNYGNYASQRQLSNQGQSAAQAFGQRAVQRWQSARSAMQIGEQPTRDLLQSGPENTIVAGHGTVPVSPLPQATRGVRRLPVQRGKMGNTGKTQRSEPYLTQGRRADRTFTKDEQNWIDRLAEKMAFSNPLFVAEEWDYDTDRPAPVTRASLTDLGKDSTEIWRGNDKITKPANAGQVMIADYKFSSNDYTYTVKLLKNPHGWPRDSRDRQAYPTVPRGTFEVVAVASKGTTSAKGRAYGNASNQAFVDNPAFTGTQAEKTAARTALGAAGYTEYANAGAAGAAGFPVGLPAPNSQPFVIYTVAAPRQDPRQSTQPADTRDVHAETTFNTDVATKLAGGAAGAAVRIMQAIEPQTHMPRTSRGTGRREPQGEAGGYSASSLMGNAGAVVGTLGSHEYCHLVADGDGGACAPTNLVPGSNQVNTEQLALEETLRHYRAKLRDKGWSIGLDVTVLLDNAPAPTPAPPSNAKGQWVNTQIPSVIKYKIILHAQASTVKRKLIARGDPPSIDLHTQFMDAKRGTIPAAEVIALQAFARSKFQDKIDNYIDANHLTGRDAWTAQPPTYTGVT